MLVCSLQQPQQHAMHEREGRTFTLAVTSGVPPIHAPRFTLITWPGSEAMASGTGVQHKSRYASISPYICAELAKKHPNCSAALNDVPAPYDERAE